MFLSKDPYEQQNNCYCCHIFSVIMSKGHRTSQHWFSIGKIGLLYLRPANGTADEVTITEPAQIPHNHRREAGPTAPSPPHRPGPLSGCTCLDEWHVKLLGVVVWSCVKDNVSGNLYSLQETTTLINHCQH